MLLMSYSHAPCESPFPSRAHPADKENIHHCSQPPLFFPSFPADLTAYPLPVRLRHSYIGNAFLTVQTHARSRIHMPDSSAHFRSHKQAHSRKLAKQQSKYEESMANSTIFNKYSFCECHDNNIVQWLYTDRSGTGPGPDQTT